MDNNTNKQIELLALREETAGTQQIGHWEKCTSFPYNGDITKQSVEETDSSSAEEPTSIPSPFARMFLAKIAFRAAAEAESWEKVPKRYQKIVSNCLDVAEIFFNYSDYKDCIDIIEWKQDDLSKDIFSKTLKIFLNSDNGQFHFDEMGSLYLLKFKGIKENEKCIIGSTSPVTLFFSVDRDLSFVSERIRFKLNDNSEHKAFDSENFCPIERRDPDFINYLFIKTRDTFGGKERFAGKELFEDFNSYLEKAVANEEIKYDRPIGYKTIEFEKEIVQEDKKVKTSEIVQIRGKEITCRDKSEDFLTDIAVMMPYKQNRKAFFSAFDEGKDPDDASFLLPLTEAFFRKYSVKDLTGPNLPLIKMSYSNGRLEVTLQISQDIHYKKIYKSADHTLITDGTFTLGIFPRVRTHDEQVSDYRIALFDKMVEKNYIDEKLELSFFKEKKQIDDEKKVHHAVLNPKTSKKIPCSVESYAVSKTHFDRIDVKMGSTRCGTIIPQFNDETIKKDNDNDNKEGICGYKFAVDFGTTNTHIEYKSDNKEPIAFDMKLPQMERLHTDYKGERAFTSSFEMCYLPDDIGGDGLANFFHTRFSFPIRSALAEGITSKKSDLAFCNCSIPFLYEKRKIPDYFKINTDLKWSGKGDVIKLYIKHIAFMLHNKVLLEGGSLKETKIIWSYPVSMDEHTRNFMENYWKDAYKEYFDYKFDTEDGDVDKVKKVSESIAPYNYHYHTDPTAVRLVTIDVGGETTDVYVKPESQSQAAYSMSFRFASNAVFGDGFGGSISSNGFIKKYKQRFEDKFELLDPDDDRNSLRLRELSDEIYSSGKSSDYISYLFSLKSNYGALDFSNELRYDKNFKYIFLIFYAAIIYHIAKSMKAKNIDMPLTVCFSGNGSRTLSILAMSKDLRSQFVKTVFEKGYGTKYSTNDKFNVIYEPNHPKEATAKGLLYTQQNSEPAKLVLLGDTNNTLIDHSNKSDEKDENKFKNVVKNKALKESIIASVKEFIRIIPELDHDLKFRSNYGINTTLMEKYFTAPDAIAKQNLEAFFNKALDPVFIDKIQPDKNEVPNETLFFYPIVGMLNNMALQLNSEGKQE